MVSAANAIASIISSSSAWISQFIHAYGYIALVVLMTLEGSSLPVASEIIVPVAGFLAAKGVLNLQLAFLAVLIGNTIGMAIAYYIGYFVGKDVVYKNLRFFRVKRQTLDSFDKWFNNNGAFAVFISRMIPEIRGLISFPAGFAKMPLKRFFSWSIFGSAIWDFALILFGYYGYFIAVNNIALFLGLIGVFAAIMYLIFRLTLSHVKKHSK